MEQTMIARRNEAMWSGSTVSRCNIMEEACERIKMERVIVRAGTCWKPKCYPYGEALQWLLIQSGEGYIATDTQAFPIEESALYVVDFDRESFRIQAGKTQLELVRVVSRMIDIDRCQIGKSHMIFPRFRPLSQAWGFTMHAINDSDSNLKASVLIENRKLGSHNMNRLCSKGAGAAHANPDCLEKYDQWCIAMPGADFTFHIDEKELLVREGDVVFIPHGGRFSSRCGDTGKIDYVFFTLSRAYENL